MTVPRASKPERQADPRLVRAREYLDGVADRLAVDGSTGEPSSARIFDAGRLGLEFFRRFGPSHARWRGTRFDFATDIQARYDAERDIAFARLSSDAAAFVALCTRMTDTDHDCRNSTSTLFSHWQGTAADQANDRMAAFLTSADTAWAAVHDLGHTLDTARESAERIVLAKARTALEVAADTVSGLSDENVRLVVTVATAPRNTLSSADVADVAELTGVAAPAVVDTVVRGARDWLDQVFTPFYETRVATFDAACERAQSALDLVWTDVRGALHAVSALRSLDDQPTQATSAASTRLAAPPMSLTAGTQPTPAAQPSTPAPTSQMPATGPTAVPPRSRDDSAGHDSGSITDRLSPGPNPSEGQAAPDMSPGDTADQNTDVVTTGHGHQDHDTQNPTPATAQAAPSGAIAGGSSPAPPRPTPESGDDEHARHVTFLKKAIAVESAMAAPTGVVGGADDPAAYNEAQQFDEDGPRPTVVEEPAHATEAPFVWQLTEDGELARTTARNDTLSGEKE
jgi:hypothetical protein